MLQKRNWFPLGKEKTFVYVWIWLNSGKWWWSSLEAMDLWLINDWLSFNPEEPPFQGKYNRVFITYIELSVKHKINAPFRIGCVCDFGILNAVWPSSRIDLLNSVWIFLGNLVNITSRVGPVSYCVYCSY